MTTGWATFSALKISTRILILFVLDIVYLYSDYQIIRAQDCTVSVSSPWSNITFVLPKSITYVNCTGRTNGSSLQLLVFFSGTDDFIAYSDSSSGLFNRRGFYSVPQDTVSIQLLINRTDGNNGTVIQCVESNSNTIDILSETTMIVRNNSDETGPTIDLHIHDIGLVKSVNITWSSLQWNAHTITVTSSITSSLVFNTTTLNYLSFTAPDNVPPCEVYNFSVTATPVGATYTGDGCSVPSPVLSRMLPSLLDGDELDELLEYTVEKAAVHNSSNITLRISTPTQYYCDEYPPSNLTLEIASDSLPHPLILTYSANDDITAQLAEDGVYTFRVWATNSVGSVVTSNRRIYTTDIQAVAMNLFDENPACMTQVRCDFIIGSNAQGCMVVVVVGNEQSNQTMEFNLTRQMNTSSASADIGNIVNEMTIIFAYDIEEDGSIGQVAVPGSVNISNVDKFLGGCSSPNNLKLTTMLLTIISITIMLTILIVIISTFIVVVTYRFRRSIGFDTSVRNHPDSQEEEDLAVEPTRRNEINVTGPIYDLPTLVQKDEEDGGVSAQYNRARRSPEGGNSLDLREDRNGSKSLKYSRIDDDSEEHHYHVLECDNHHHNPCASNNWDNISVDLDCPELPPPYNPESSPLVEPPAVGPMYHEITELPKRMHPDKES